jgi:hypothetical protein
MFGTITKSRIYRAQTTIAGTESILPRPDYTIGVAAGNGTESGISLRKA